MKKILVTGSSGYVGKNFIGLFSNKYEFVNFSLLEGTVYSLNIDKVDVVLHCAALVHQKREHNYAEYDRINTKYPIELAQKAKENGVKHFVFISTVAVYGDKTKLDDFTKCDPITFYGKSKFEAEKKLKQLEDENFIVSIIRPPMIYGKNAPGNIKTLIKLIRTLPILPFAKIDNKRSFVYIENLCSMIDTVIQQRKNGIFLIADDQSISTTELIELIAKALDKKIYLINIPFFKKILNVIKPSLYQKLYCDLEIITSKNEDILHYKNKYTIENGIKLTIT